MKALKILVLSFALLASPESFGAAMSTLTNFNAVYFLVDANPTATPTNVILLSGNITNWQKLETNVIVSINPTDGYMPYRSNAFSFADSPFYRYDSKHIGFNSTNTFLSQPTSTDLGLGSRTLEPVTGGLGFNTAMGYHAARTLTSGGRNTALGGQAMEVCLAAINNTAIGVNALQHSTNGQCNTAIGSEAGNYAGTNNTYIGFQAGQTSTNKLNQVAIGYNAKATNDNEIVIGNTSNTNVLFVGVGGGAFHIAQVIWDDSMVPEALVRVGPTAPTQANFNGGPGQTLQFQNNRDDAVLASVQLSHRYKQGTDIYPHVHWAETATTGAGTNIVWELQYTWANPDEEVFPAYATITMTNSVTGTNWFHSMESFPAVSGVGRKVSTIMVFQLRRLASTATADDYDKSIAFLGFDLHYQVDSPGSDSPTGKTF